jgi:hypothetical protein
MALAEPEEGAAKDKIEAVKLHRLAADQSSE